jgi:hypothetical protein
MKRLAILLAALPLVVTFTNGTADAQETAPSPTPPNVIVEGPAPAVTQPGLTPQPVQALTQPAPPAPAPPPVLQQPTPQQAAAGQWVNTDNGWIWVPAGETTYVVQGVPYAYLYTPVYGWTWYASPWGVGPYYYGAWAHRPWPYGYRAWAYGPHGWGWHYGAARAIGGHPGVHYGGGYRGGPRFGGGGHFGGGAHFGGGGHFGGHGGGGHGHR